MLTVIADLPEGSQWFVVTDGYTGDYSGTYHCCPSLAPHLARLVFGTEKPRYILPVHS